MKIIFLIFACILFLNSCGKKSDPKYQSKNNQIILVTL